MKDSSVDSSAKDEPPPAKKARFDMSQNQIKTIPNRLLEQAEQEQQQHKSLIIDPTQKGLATATSLLAKCIARNEMDRAEQLDDDENAVDPSRFMSSEVALYEHIVAFKSLAASASELYQYIADPKSGGKQSLNDEEHDLLEILCQLLLHPNPDIGTSVVSVLLEWMDPSLLEDDPTALRPMLRLAQRILKEATDALVESLDRLGPVALGEHDMKQTLASTESDNEDDEVGKGTEDIISLFENLMEIELLAATADAAEPSEPLIAPDINESATLHLCRQTRLFPWLLQQVDAVNQGTELSSLHGRAMELLANFAPREEIYTVVPDWSRLPLCSGNFIEDDDGAVQKGTSEKKCIDGIEVILMAVASFKKKQPSDEMELEFLENACIIMASALTYSAANVHAFLRCQGVELVIRCLKERVHAGGVALKWLDFGSGKDAIHTKACETIVDAGALKYLFPILMGRSMPRHALESTKKEKKEWLSSLETAVVRILYGLTRHLRDDSPHDVKTRLLAKFTDNEKCDRLVELCLLYSQKARVAEFKFFKSDVEDELEDEEAVQLAALDAKLEGGGELYHRLAAIIAFCCLGSRHCHERVLEQLHMHQNGMNLIVDALEEFCSVLDAGQQKEQLQRYLKGLL